MSEDVYFRKMGEQKSQKRSDVSLLMIRWNQGRVISADQGDVCKKKKQHGQEQKEKRPIFSQTNRKTEVHCTNAGNRKTKGKNDKIIDTK